METREDEHAHAHAHRRGDTRARIQQVALELFAAQGYERTSLREVAERLGVTKAALYYHFKSKEDIVCSFTEDYFGRIPPPRRPPARYSTATSPS
jgi:AcrR family transcriptional regulator